MPCMGPDYNHADQQAEKAYKEVMEFLNEKYQILITGNTSGVFGKKYDAARQQLKDSMKNLFNVDASDGF